MGQHQKEFYGVAVGSSGYESLINGGEYSITKGGDGTVTCSSLLIASEIPESSVVNSVIIRFDGKQSRSNTSLYKSYIRFVPYALNSYAVNGNSYSYSTKRQIGDFEIGTLNDNWNPYQVDLTSYINDITDVCHGIRLAIGMRFDGTVSTVTNKSSVKNIRIYVLYTIPEYTISVSAGTGGTVSGGGTFEQGKTVTIKATPNSGYRFVKWSDGNTNASRTVTVSGNATYTAVFEKLTYAITASAGAGGTISPSGSTRVGHGDSKTYTITPNEGYEIDTVTVDGVNKGAVSSFTFSNVTAAHTISVTFKQIKINPPEFTSASLTYAGSQVSAGNKVPAGESCILSVGIS